MSEIQRITRRAKERCAEGRASFPPNSSPEFIVDLIYLLERSTMIIEKLCEGKEAVSDDTITIKRLQDIIAAIGDDNLSAFFMAKMYEGIGYPAPKEPMRIASA